MSAFAIAGGVAFGASRIFLHVRAVTKSSDFQCQIEGYLVASCGEMEVSPALELARKRLALALSQRARARAREPPVLLAQYQQGVDAQ